MRSSELVNLALDDIDWTAGTVRGIAKSKSRRIDVLPLPQTTGRAIVEYLRTERPTTANRRIFVPVAPVDKPVGPNVVRRAVRDAYQRCGLPYNRVDILRHTLASRLLDAGGTLKEVADVLRHRELDTSLIYAKVDMARLSAVATRQHVRRTSTVTAPRRLEVLRPFTAYYRQFEPGTEVLPKGTLGRSHQRLAPHIYTEAEVLELRLMEIVGAKFEIFAVEGGRDE